MPYLEIGSGGQSSGITSGGVFGLGCRFGLAGRAGAESAAEGIGFGAPAAAGAGGGAWAAGSIALSSSYTAAAMAGCFKTAPGFSMYGGFRLLRAMIAALSMRNLSASASGVWPWWATM